MRENITYFIQKAMVTNNHGNGIIWACQMVLTGSSPHLALSQPLCGGRKAGDQATGRLWGVKEFSSVKQRKCSMALLFLLHPACRMGHARRIKAIFPAAAERGVVITSLRDVHYYPGLQGWLIQNPCMGASARGGKKPIWMSWALLDE